jgi:hypothetical protein
MGSDQSQHAVGPSGSGDLTLTSDRRAGSGKKLTGHSYNLQQV